MALNNPAARLHNILVNCRKDKELRNQPMLIGWRTVLSLPAEIEDITVMYLVGKIFLLPSQITQELSQFPDIDMELFLGWKTDMTSAFKKINFESPFASFYDRLSDSLLVTIKFCAHELSKRRPEKIVDEAQLGELKQQVYDLYTEVLKTDLPTDIRRYLLDHLYEIIDAIDCYMVTGACPIQRAVDGVIGSFVTDGNTVRQTLDKEVGKKFWSTMNKAAILLSISKTALELGEGAAKLLGCYK
jgi:hypothetical protein